MRVRVRGRRHGVHGGSTRRRGKHHDSSVDARHAGGRCSFRSSDAILEPEDASLHLRRAQQDSHHRSREVASPVQRCIELSRPHGGQRRNHSVRRHQAGGSGVHRGRSATLRHALRQPALAWRHADQLPYRQAVDQAAEGARGADRGRRSRSGEQEGRALAPARAGEARARSGRNQEHGRHPGRAVHHRRGLREDCGGRGGDAGHSGRRGRRHEQRPRRRRLHHSRERRRDTFDRALCFRSRDRGSRRPGGGAA